MKKIKILETIRQGKIGGGETHVLELCTHLDKSKYEPIVLSFTEGPMVEELKKRNIKTKVINTLSAFDFGIWKQVTDFIQEENIDIVHAHGTRANSNVFWAAKRLSLPLIYTIHGWSFHLDQKYYIKKLRELSEKFLTNQANINICVSKSNEEDGINLFNLKRSMVIHNAINLEKFNPNNSFKNIRKELNIDNNKTVIGYIARNTVQKDPFTMLRAMKKIIEKSDNIILLMVGDGDLKNESLKLASELDITNNVIFQPFRTDIPDILNAIDIFCLPSLWEGFPIGILEAMAMKKCVVASPVDGNKELISDRRNGLLVEVGNSTTLASTILNLAENKFLQKKLADSSYEFVKANYSIKTLVTKVESLYSNAIDL